jgi:putative protein-disulfide isomerase
MSTKKIIYIMDAHCGWCYGNSQNITKLHQLFSNTFEFEILVGGMWLAQQAPFGGPELSSYIKTHAPTMSKTTGAIVSEKFYDLARNSNYQFSSLEPSAAITLVKEIAPQESFSFAKKVQEAIFVSGLPLNVLSTYLPILKELNIDSKAFESKWMKDENLDQTYKEFEFVKPLANGFPSLILEQSDSIYMLASGYFDLDQMIQNFQKI